MKSFIDINKGQNLKIIGKMVSDISGKGESHTTNFEDSRYNSSSNIIDFKLGKSKIYHFFISL